jgi:glutathione S-transferase
MNEYILYHFSLCPFSRKVRFFLNESEIKYQKEEVEFWKREPFFMKLNPACETPILYEKKKDLVIVDSFVIVNYLANLSKTNFWYEKNNFFETQRLEMWFDKKFYNEVSKYILEEKLYNLFTKKNINGRRLRAGQQNLDEHIKYMEYLLNKRKWLAGEHFSLADIAGATQISCLDYLGEVRWNRYKTLKRWYLIIKSKPSFVDILQDRMDLVPPVKYYSEVDFD